MSAECRKFLIEALGSTAAIDAGQQAHLATCKFCAARVAAQAALAPMLRSKPRVTAGGLANNADLLAGVYARAVAQAEASPLGEMLSKTLPATAGLVDVRPDAGWPEPLLDSDIARLASMSPPRKSRTEWSRVRGAILAQVAAGTAPRVRRWVVAAVSAAAVTIGFLVVSRGTHEVPTIVFRDLDSRDLAALPLFDFAVVRHGAPR